MHRTPVVVILAIVFGFLGATVRDFFYPRSGFTRARGLEIVSRGGAVIGRWGEDESGNALLEFRDQSGRKTIEIGIGAGHSAYIHLNGPDSKSRVNLHVIEGQPILAMSDERTEGRLMLGVVGGQVRKNEGALWGLSVREQGSYRPGASLLVTALNGMSASEGQLYLQGNGQRLLLTPRSHRAIERNAGHIQD